MYTITKNIVHQTWEAIGETGGMIGDGIEGVLPTPPSVPQIQNPTTWEEIMAAGHKKIDKWFSTDQAKIYEDGGSLLPKSMVIGELPPPNGLLKEINDVSKVARTIRIGEEAAIIGEEFVASNLVRIQPNGIWEIQGKNIKRFDINRIFREENKIDHLFKKEHQLHKLNSSNEVVIEKITKAIIEADLSGKIPLNKPFEIKVVVDGHVVEVHGTIINEELRYGTFL